MENNNIEKKENKEPMTTKQKVFFGLRIAFNVVFYALIIFLFLFSIMNIRGGNGTESFPNIFGRGFLSVQSDSMERDEKKTILPEWNNYEIGGFTTGDLLNVKTFSESDADKLKVGDVITFKWNINAKPVLNTHRIVDIHKNDDGQVDYVITQGDKVAQTAKYNPKASAAEIYTQYNSGIIENVSVEKIKGIVTSINSGAGKTLDTIQKNWLFIFVIPIIVLLVIEVFLVVRNIMILRGEKNKLELADSKEAMMNEVEAERERMRQELLAELRAQGLAPQEEVKEEPKVEKPQEETVATEDAKDEPSEEVKLDSNQEETQVEEQPTESTVEAEDTKVEDNNDSEVEDTTEEVKDETKPQEEVENKEE